MYIYYFYDFSDVEPSGPNPGRLIASFVFILYTIVFNGSEKMSIVTHTFPLLNFSSSYNWCCVHFGWLDGEVWGHRAELLWVGKTKIAPWGYTVILSHLLFHIVYCTAPLYSWNRIRTYFLIWYRKHLSGHLFKICTYLALIAIVCFAVQ